MREKHPIDERFRQALYNREADPPEAVRAALGAHLGWSTAPRAGGSWWSLAIVAVGLFGTGAALWAWQGAASSTAMNGEHRVAEQRIEASGVPTNEAAPVASSASGNPLAPVDPVAGSTTNTNSAIPVQLGIITESTSAGSGNALTESSDQAAASTFGTVRTSVSVDPSKRSALAVRPNTRSAGTSFGISATSAASNSPDPDGVPPEGPPPAEAQGSTLNGPEPLAIVREDDLTSQGQDLRPVMMDPLHIAPDDLVPSGTPITKALPPNYVLPSGTWWIGPYIGVGTVRGTWKGADADALREAEQWRSTAQAGLLVGRDWRSGWGVSAGLGLARVRSAFHHEDATEWSSVVDVDTTWGTTMHTSGDILYSWQIDSLTEELPSGFVRKDARNLYTAIQVPVLLSWHADARRLRYGAFGGITAWVPAQRRGLTLVRSQQDIPPTTLALQDPKVNDRFSTQVHGVAGLSVGYTIIEQLSAYAEPMISAPLFSFDGGSAPWLTRPILQFRIQYELRSQGH